MYELQLTEEELTKLMLSVEYTLVDIYTHEPGFKKNDVSIYAGIRDKILDLMETIEEEKNEAE